MILTIDIGNSNITIGAYRGDALLFLTRMGTDRSKMPDEYAIAIHSLLRLYGYHGSDLEGAVISSVVPSLFLFETGDYPHQAGTDPDCGAWHQNRPAYRH